MKKIIFNVVLLGCLVSGAFGGPAAKSVKAGNQLYVDVE